ncbi:MAG: hypothetical protein KIS92_09470 [Planctomycetota bacterium]|nr:hypothetical protein [Planctomycetota bacterium]
MRTKVQLWFGTAVFLSGLCLPAAETVVAEKEPVTEAPKPASLEFSIYDGRILPWPKPDAAKTEALAKELRAQLPADKFIFLTVGPWVIGTDLDESEARSFAASTIAVYAARIQKQLFTKAARKEPVKVFLFKDENSYTAWNVKLFKDRPSTPYGYFSREKRAMVMNIGTGGGTLLHEMTHAMAEADFPEIPAWLNEGLGSLFEASMDRNGRVAGFTNWRLDGLKRDLADGSEVHYHDLLRMSDQEFYGGRSGSNYASARYLMQYLQDHEKLEEFYARVRDGKDASAEASLITVFGGQKTIAQIETEVYAWVKKLKRR